MKFEVVLVGALASLALLPVVLSVCRFFGTRRFVPVGLGGWILLSGAVGFATVEYDAHLSTHRAPVLDRPVEHESRGYLGSKSCRSCHPHEYQTWEASYHRAMTQVLTEENLVPEEFDGVELQHFDNSYRLEKRGGEFWVHPVFDRADFGNSSMPFDEPVRLVMSTGSHHFQAFWHPTKGRDLKIFEFCYRIDDQRWMPIDAAFVLPPGSRLVNGPPGLWNRSCIRCHATGAEPRLTEGAPADTHVAELGIACEACHGPTAEHVRLNQNPRRRFRQHFADGGDPSVVNPERLDPHRSADACGQCHSVTALGSPEEEEEWRRNGFSFRPGDDLEGQRNILKEGEHWFWSDGMIRVSGREYNGLIKSPCYEHGKKDKEIMTCLSCHQLHKPQDDPRPDSVWAEDQLRLGMDTNQACLQCHGEYGSDSALTAHTNHEASSSGSLCYNCHMPHTTYGLLKGIRSHQISSPSVQESSEVGRPNACNLCHLDRTLAWTGQHLDEWYGISNPELSEDQQSIATGALWSLQGDAGMRALMASSFAWETAQEVSGTSWMPPFLSQLMVDAYDAVRCIAYRTLKTLPAYEDFEFDFMAPFDARAQASQQAYSRWIRTMREDPVSLDKKRLALDQEVYRRLLHDRDNRPITLAE